MSAQEVPSGKNPKGLVYKGKWRVLHPLTETDRSYVFLGTPLQGGAPVAIKVLKERRAKDSKFMKAHHADLQAAVALPAHPGLIPTFDAGWVNGRYVVVTEWCPGEPLPQRMRKPRPIPYPAVLSATRQVLEILRFAGESGIRYRHIEPEHLIFDESTRKLRLLRFSIPRAARLGIPVADAIDADIQLVGSLFSRMLFGDQAPQSADLAEMIADPLKARVAQVYPEVTPGELHDLAVFFVRSTSRDTERRYPSFEAQEKDLLALERAHKPLVEERDKVEKKRRQEAFLGSAYDTMMALMGEHDSRRFDLAEEEDLQQLRIQRFLLLGVVGLLLLLVASLLRA